MLYPSPGMQYSSSCLSPVLSIVVAGWKQSVLASATGPSTVKERTTSSPWVSSVCQWILSLPSRYKMRWHPTFQWLLSHPNLEAKSSAPPQITGKDSNGWLAILTLPCPHPPAFDAEQYKAWRLGSLPHSLTKRTTDDTYNKRRKWQTRKMTNQKGYEQDRRQTRKMANE